MNEFPWMKSAAVIGALGFFGILIAGYAVLLSNSQSVAPSAVPNAGQQPGGVWAQYIASQQAIQNQIQPPTPTGAPLGTPTTAPALPPPPSASPMSPMGPVPQEAPLPPGDSSPQQKPASPKHVEKWNLPVEPGYQLPKEAR